MAASHSLKLKTSFPRLLSLLQLKRFNHTSIERGLEAEFLAELGPETMVASGHVYTSNWKRVDSTTLGINLSMIPDSSRIVLKILQNEGHDAYLVGGCVRDLLLNKTPKDFDVITSANLQEVKKKFHRAFIVGRRFPICRVHVRGSAIEVSSFKTVARDAKVKEDFHLYEMPEGYDEKDLMRWKNSLHRDFTINSLFYDPFAHKIYDYSSGMADLTSMKLQTLVPSHLSFQEDCARILRGLRIAARLGLTFAKDTEKAMCDLYASVTTLGKVRLMMEMNYMLSYGAAEPSLLILKRFNLLEVLLPFHAAYLANHSVARTPLMFMKLFYNLDSVVSCGQPCGCSLWVSLLTFHLALVNNPQDALVVWTLSSLLYHGQWKEGVKVARQLAEEHVNFLPEILETANDVMDEELAQKVTNFVSIILDSIDTLTDSGSLRKAMACYPSSPCSGLVFVSKNAGKEAAQVFNLLVDDIESLRNERHYYGIDYKLLGVGNIEETRFVLGKVIMDTLRGGVTHSRAKLLTEKKDNFRASKPKAEQVEVEKPSSKVSDRRGTPLSKIKRVLGVLDDDQVHQQRPKKQKQNKSKKSSALQQKLVGEDTAKKKQQLKKVVVKDVKKLLSMQKVAAALDVKLDKGKHSEALSSKEILNMLQSAPKMANQVQLPPKKAPKTPNQHETQTRKKTRSVLEKAPKTPNQHEAQARKKTRSVLEKTPKSANLHETQARKKTRSVLEKAPKTGEQHEAEGRTEILNVLRLSNIFKCVKEVVNVKKDVKPEKEHTDIVGEQPPQRIPKLSSIFS